MMRKFPCLEELYINHSWRDELQGNDGLNIAKTSCFTSSTLTKFISFIIPIPSCVVSIYVPIPLAVDALEEYTRLMSHGSFTVISINYAYDSVLDPKLKQQEKLTMHRTTGYKTNQDHEFFIDYSSIADNLPHLGLTEKIGSSLAELTYRMTFDHISKENNRKAYDMIHGYFLDHVFHHCPHLKKLRVSSTKLLDSNPVASSSRSISHLVLLNCYIGKDMLSQLSKRIVSLTNLVIIRCQLENPYNGTVNTRYYHIDMSSTSFDVVRIKSSHTILLVAVKLNQGDQDEYHNLLFDPVLNGYRAEKSTRFAYKLMSDYEKNMKVYIRCKSIKKIQMYTNASVDGGKVFFGEIIPV